uniref:SEFIR domain-containing protein n=1 Tax=Electrophorus electricus TaxID=8005 RepID=A0A4W4HCP7_ELEEL
QTLLNSGMPNCSDDGWVKPRHEAPKMHPEVHSEVSVRTDAKGDIVPVLCLRLTQPSDGKSPLYRGININLCLTVLFFFAQWSFVLDRIVIEPGLKYQISVSNLPKPDVGRHPRVQTIIVPGELQRLRVCLENGGLYLFHTDNLTSISVNFSLEAWQLQLCDFVFVVSSNIFDSLSVFQFIFNSKKYFNMFLQIKPFFVRCMNNCLDYQQNVHIYMSSSSHDVTDKDEPKSILIQEPSKVLIIYSLDHPMYKDIVLKLCAFLRAKCGTDATLDLLDSSWISTIGRMQWLDMQRASLTRSSDKVLLLCSPGVQAKWKAMCRGVRVVTREDARTPMGDMLTPALSLITPDFMHVLSFQKYIVAYFEDICSERDIPAPFNVAVKYQLMKHFEEIFFRLLDKEKHEPGRIKHVEGIRGDEYHSCPSGRALRDAIEAFRAYQLVNPDWFEMEIVDADEDITLEQDEDVKINCNRVLQNELQVTEIVTRVVISEMTSPRHEPEESLTMVMHVVPT